MAMVRRRMPTAFGAKILSPSVRSSARRVTDSSGAMAQSEIVLPESKPETEWVRAGRCKK